jgi:hypothetical protein
VKTLSKASVAATMSELRAACRGGQWRLTLLLHRRGPNMEEAASSSPAIAPATTRPPPAPSSALQTLPTPPWMIHSFTEAEIKAAALRTAARRDGGPSLCRAYLAGDCESSAGSGGDVFWMKEPEGAGDLDFFGPPDRWGPKCCVLDP